MTGGLHAPVGVRGPISLALADVELGDGQARHAPRQHALHRHHSLGAIGPQPLQRGRPPQGRVRPRRRRCAPVPRYDHAVGAEAREQGRRFTLYSGWDMDAQEEVRLRRCELGVEPGPVAQRELKAAGCART